MKKGFTDKIPFLTITALGLFFIFFFYGRILMHPNDFMFANEGDGLKNYYTYAYHIKYDSSYTNFEGMNYPYGENFLYTDCHPIFAVALKILSSDNSYMETHSVGILNFFLIISIFLSFIVVFFLLIELKIQAWISVFFSVGIILSAPQIFRLGGHLALSYSFAIPLSWLLFLKYARKQKIFYALLLFINLLFWMFIHAYLGIIIFSFLLSLLFVKIFSDEHKKKLLHIYIKIGMAVILPVVIYYVFAKLTDTHTGRTINPSGFFLYNAEPDDVFIPHQKPFRPLFELISPVKINLKWEARGYVGFINTLLFFTLTIIALFSTFNKKAKKKLKILFKNKSLNRSLIAASIILLFAMGIPFKQFPKLLEIFPIFKQFRATGRFVWPFYFVFSAFAAYVFQTIRESLLADKLRKISGISVLIIAIGISWFEGLFYHNNESRNISRFQNLFNDKFIPENIRKSIDHINPEDYQAMISLPFFYYGSESYERPRKDDAVQNSLVFSYHTGIPNICTNLTRTSVEESKRIIQILTPNYYDKKIINDLKSNKPFLILKTGNDLSRYETIIADKAISVIKFENFELLEITKEDLFSDDRYYPVNKYKKNRSDLALHRSFYVNDTSAFFYYKDFENLSSDTVFRGKGSFRSMKKGKNILAEIPPNTFEKDKYYDFSLWMFNNEPDALNLSFKCIIEEIDKLSGQVYLTEIIPEQAEVITENWSLIEGTFRLHDPKHKIFIYTIGKDNSKSSFHADDLLIKEKDTEVYKYNKEESTLFYNNHKIRQE